MTSHPADAGIAPGTISPARANYVLAVLFAVMMLNFLDRQVIALLAEPIKREMGLSDQQIGLMTGLSFAMVYTLISIPLSIVADRWNRSRLIAIAVAAWSLATVMCGQASNFGQLFLARIGVGIGEAGSGPGSHSLIAALFPPDRRASALGVLGAAIPVGSFLAYTGGGLMVQYFDWRTAFLLAGAPGLVVALLLWFTVPEPRGSPPLSAIFVRPPGAPTFRAAVGELARIPAYWHLMAATTLISFISYGLAAFTAGLVVRVHGIGYGELGLKLGVMVGLTGFIGAVLGGRVGDWLNRQRPGLAMHCVVVTMLFAGPGMIAAVYAPSADLTFLLLAIPTFAATAYFGPTYALIQKLASDANRALAVALFVLPSGLIGLGLGPVFVGTLSDLFSGGIEANEGAALQRALGIVALFYFWAAFHFWRAQASLTKRASLIQSMEPS